MMALGSVNQYNFNQQQIDEYDYDDADDFYDDNINSFNSNNYHEVDDSEGNEVVEKFSQLNRQKSLRVFTKMKKIVCVFFSQILKKPVNQSMGERVGIQMNHSKLKSCK